MFDSVRVCAAAAAGLSVLCGCAIGGGVRSSTASEELETEYSSVYAERIVFDGFADKEYQSVLNMAIDDDVTRAVSEFDDMAREIRSDMPENVKAMLKITQNVKRADSGIVSLIEEHYIYVGGTHGSVAWFPRNIRIDEAEPHNLALAELFADDEYLEKLNGIIEDMTEAEPDKYGQLWDEPILTEDNENMFYITDNDLVIYFPPYTLSYYAKGFIEFPIRLTHIEGLLSPDYKDALLSRAKNK